MKRQQNRTLGAFEKTFWLLDQIDSKDFALAADIVGTQPIEKWRNAIQMVQKRHPNLSVRVVLDELARPTLQHVENLHIPLRVVHAQQGYRWQQEVEKELSVRFNTEEGPLLRVVLVQNTDSTVLILVANHTVADGTSLSVLTRDILLAVTGKELEPMAPQVSNDETLDMPEDLPAQTFSKVLELKMKTDIVKPLVSSHRFSEDITRNILERARQENTTVHGAICAAVLVASRKMRPEWDEAKMELVSPICTRAALNLDDNFGLNITTQSVFFEKKAYLTFWDLARLAKAGLEGTNSVEYVTGYLSFFRDIVFGHNDIQQMLDALKQAFNHHIMVTNLVKVRYKTDFGPLKLEALYGPMVRSGKGMEQTIGALTSNGSLCLTNTSDTPIPGLLVEMEKILREACQGTTVVKNVCSFQ
ncbi:condensation domain-containing protein [Dyadobacter chenwenxiniae]|uniref:Phthiocerol/phthiodiolone dimycocerosyl transferase n=1 Tax=Dyadobacter chenwenxiniae TaxID=2906456 RepID=A0A9X1PSR5_9BACT|nr:condensation domain-containing protein [Dyadobacter chenwenxiniae]MCF0064431.1 condensation domain-containing protein [Dyadobacter chenwenxiniae]UON82364.1 condensation domain-containing protein [Dyadobacter chenwenxiniae]